MPSPVLPEPPADPAGPPAPNPPEDHLEDVLVQRSSPVNLFLIGGSVALALWTSFGENFARLLPWFITSEEAQTGRRLLEVRHGEVWRLFTPAFIHFGTVHLGFNMLNLYELGKITERRINSWNYFWLVSGIAVFVDLMQYFATGNPHFGGMSGVIYGLIGYMWVRGKFDDTFGLELSPEAVALSLIWLVLGFTNFLPKVGNIGHAAGLGLGVLWGIWDSRRAMANARRG